MLTRINNDHRAVMIDMSKCKIVHSDLMHRGAILNVPYHGLWISRRESWMRIGEGVRLNISIISRLINMT
jgi:hypothetical protein